MGSGLGGKAEAEAGSVGGEVAVVLVGDTLGDG